MSPEFDYVTEVPGVPEADVVVKGTTERGRLVGYSVVLRVRVEDEPRSVCLYDNADAEDEHHVHRYSTEGVKQPPEVRPYGSPSEALNAALGEIKANAAGIIRAWRR